MRALVVVAAETVVRDADTNAISIFNIAEGYTVQGFPVLIQRIAFFVLTEREPGEPERLKGQVFGQIGGQELFRSPVEVDFQGKLRHRSINTVGGLILTEPGLLRFTMELEHGFSASYVVAVVAAAQAAPPEATVAR